MAEALLQDRLDQRGAKADVSSAGVIAQDRPATDEVIELMAGRGLDVTAHRSRLLSAPMVSRADLVLGMAREHVREAVLLDPAAFARSFTFKELVHLAQDAGARPADQAFDDWLACLSEGRTPVAHLGLSDSDDVDDPMGRRFSFYKRVAAEIEQLTDLLVDLAWPGQPAEQD